MALTERLGVAATVAQIAGAIARERWWPGSPPDTAETVPQSAEAISARWLTSTLCKDVPGAQVIGVEVIGGDNGTSARRAINIGYNDAGHAAGLPHRLFSKSTATFYSRMLLGITGIAEGEALFYNDVRPSLKLRSPNAYYSGYDPRSHRSLVLLEDLAAAGWTFPDPLQNPVTRADAEDMVIEMAAYHSALWDSPRLDRDLRALRPALSWQENLNRKVGFEKRTLKGLERAKAVVPEVLYRQRAEFYTAFMTSLSLHQTGPTTLLHQDLHLGNWLRDEDAKMGLYDWQCVARGNWALDYSYALAGALDPDDRRDWEEDLLRFYLERLRDGGVQTPPTFDEAWLAYRQQAMHGWVFGLFTLGGSLLEPQLQPRDYTMAAIERISQHVADLDSVTLLR